VPEQLQVGTTIKSNRMPGMSLYSAVAFSTAFVFLFLRTFLLPAVPFAVNGDEVLFFSRALRILHGQIIYRDFFELVGPGTELLYAFGFRLFGVHGWVIGAWHIVLGAALCVIITFIARQLLSGTAVFLPMLMFLAFDFSSAMDATHHWWSTLAALSAVAILIQGQKPWQVTLAGGLCGVATLFTQTQGALVLLAMAAFLALVRAEGTVPIRKQLVLLFLPFVGVCACVFGYYAYVAGFHRLISDLLIFPLTGLSGPVNSPKTYLHQLPPFHRVGDLVRGIPFLVIYALVPYCYFFNLYGLVKRRRNSGLGWPKQLLLLDLVGLSLFLSIISGPRFFRICTVAAPALLICVWTVSQPGEVRKILRYALWCTSVAFMLWLPVHRQLQWHRTLQLPTGTVAFADEGQWQEMVWLAQRTSPGDTMFNDGAAILYLRLHNPTHTEFVNNDDFTSASDVNRILQTMQELPPQLVALVPDIAQTPHDHSKPFTSYIHARYCLAETFYLGSNRFREEVWQRGHSCSPR